MRDALRETAESCLGIEDRKQPDWFRDNAATIEPSLQKRNKSYIKWLSSGQEEDRRKFTKARCDARRTVREAKNAWFQAKAEEAQRDRFSGKQAWQCIRDMQHGRRGLIPTRCITIKDESGVPCTSTQAQEERWRRHFTKVLNVQSQFCETELDRVRQRPTRTELKRYHLGKK